MCSRWLKHNSVTIPRVGKLVDLKMENLQVLCERVAWLKHMHVHGRDLGVILTRQPCILSRPQAELDELIGLLERAGIRREWVGFVISRSPAVLSLSSQGLIKKLLFFENLGVTPQQLGPMAFNFPASIGHFHIDEMQTKVQHGYFLNLILYSSPQPQFGFQYLVPFFLQIVVSIKKYGCCKYEFCCIILLLLVLGMYVG